MKLGLTDAAVRRIAAAPQGEVPPLLYHVSNMRFDSFSADFLATGVVWFAKDRESLLESGHGSDADFRKPVYLYTCATTASHPASWDEYDKYSMDELESQGYDSLDVDDDFVVFDPEKVEILDVERMTR
jgi:hypothetical protein